MFRNDSHNCHCIWPDCKWCVHVKFNRCIIHSHCFFQHGKIIDGTVIAAVVVCKCHIGCCQSFTVCKFDIIPDLNSPGKSIIAHRIICRQVHTDRKICVCSSKCALDQWLMHMLSCAPSICRVKTGLRLRCCRHGYDYFIFRCAFFLCRKYSCRSSCKGCCHTDRHHNCQ